MMQELVTQEHPTREHLTPWQAVQATTDQQVLALWMHGHKHSAATVDAYTRDIPHFLDFVGKDLRTVTLGDVQAYKDALQALPEATADRRLAAVKSLFTFAQKLGYLIFNPAALVKLPKRKETLAQRIMSECDAHRMIALEPDNRNRILLRLLYASGVRVSELCGLKWKDCQERPDGGQVSVLGKGDKTRAIYLSTSTWQDLVSLKGGAAEEEPVFWSKKTHGHLDRTQVFRIVQAAAKRVGLKANVSPHWLRHAHASHAIDHGAPLHVVQATLGHESLKTTGAYLHARPQESSSRYLSV